MKMSTNKKKSGFGKFIAGAIVGAGIGVLFAPKKGSETRAELKAKINELLEKAKEIDKEDVKKYIEDKTNEIKKALEDLDKEKVLTFAKEKAQVINQKAEELVKYVIEKGTPVMEKTATAIREKAADITRDVLKRLEKEDKKEQPELAAEESVNSEE